VSEARLPGGWVVVATLLATLAAGVWIAREVFRAVPGPTDRYAAERAAALERGIEATPALLEQLAADALSVRAGAQTFQAHCARCHGARAQGDVGPNLTDGAWLVAGDPATIYATIVEGRAAKGMPSWASQLGPARCKQVAAFVLSVRGTDVPGRAPEGRPWPPAAR
jgi:cytochrome c oxidase cbb3-type subunit 3